MSDSPSIAAVSAALRRLLERSITPTQRSLRVEVGRPDKARRTDSAPEIHVCLLGVVPDAMRRNVALPTRRPDGSLVQRPLLPVALRYLLTVDGDSDTYEPELLLGSVLSTLTQNPVLTREDLQEATAGVERFAGFAAASQPERISMSLVDLPVEALHALQSTLHAPPRLGVVFDVRPVLLGSDAAAPRLEVVPPVRPVGED